MSPDENSKDSDESGFITVTPAEYQEVKKNQKLETASSKAQSKNSTFVQFRIKPDEAKFLSDAATALYNEGVIKAPTISALAKSCFFTQMNQWLLIQQKDAMIIEHCKRMNQLRSSVSSGISYVPW
jgi:hypothetical protein